MRVKDRCSRELQILKEAARSAIPKNVEVLDGAAPVSGQDYELPQLLHLTLSVVDAGRTFADIVQVHFRFRDDGLAPPVFGPLADLHDLDAVLQYAPDDSCSVTCLFVP